MAPIEPSSHSFQKLRLDTHAPLKPAPSSFASIPRHDSQGDDHPSSYTETPDLLEQDYHFYSDVAQRRDRGAQNGHLVSYDGATAPIGIDDIESTFRKRKTSISFNNEVTLDSGNRLSIEEPLPKPVRPETLPEVSDSEEFAEEDYLTAPLNRRRHMQHRVGESRYPLLQSTVDDLAVDPEYHDQDRVASLTSATTASPPEEVSTPLESSAEYLLSPIPASSPIEFPQSFSRRHGVQRTRSYRSELGDGDGSIRKTSRRSSTRSGRSLSSMSPAASFLSRYKAADGPLKPPEPDDEGQGIGYHGEYIIGSQIGYGGFSVVKKVKTIEDGVEVTHAVKIVRKQLKDKTELENEEIQTQFDHEVEIWRFLRHPYILPLLRVYNTDFATFCITRLNEGGTLFDLVRNTRKMKKNGLPEHLVKRYTYQLASAIRYLHNDVMVVHRDVKLENCLLDMTVPRAETDGGDVLLCDFGMADFVVSDQRDGPEPHSVGLNPNIGPADTSTTVAGSLKYAAPELLNAPGPLFSTAADIWAFGVIVYTLFTAQQPFDGGMDQKTVVKIRNGEWDLEPLRSAEALQRGGLDDAIDLVQGCLDMDPDRRWNIHDILNCAWLDGCMPLYENVSRSWLADT